MRESRITGCFCHSRCHRLTKYYYRAHRVDIASVLLCFCVDDFDYAVSHLINVYMRSIIGNFDNLFVFVYYLMCFALVGIVPTVDYSAEIG